MNNFNKAYLKESIIKSKQKLVTQIIYKTIKDKSFIRQHEDDLISIANMTILDLLSNYNKNIINLDKYIYKSIKNKLINYYNKEHIYKYNILRYNNIYNKRPYGSHDIYNINKLNINNRDLDILNSYTDCVNKPTLKELGSKYNVSHETIRKSINKTINKLKDLV